jgi:hypothetical protein
VSPGATERVGVPRREQLIREGREASPRSQCARQLHMGFRSIRGVWQTAAGLGFSAPRSAAHVGRSVPLVTMAVAHSSAMLCDTPATGGTTPALHRHRSGRLALVATTRRTGSQVGVCVCVRVRWSWYACVTGRQSAANLHLSRNPRDGGGGGALANNRVDSRNTRIRWCGGAPPELLPWADDDALRLPGYTLPTVRRQPSSPTTSSDTAGIQRTPSSVGAQWVTRRRLWFQVSASAYANSTAMMGRCGGPPCSICAPAHVVVRRGHRI